VAAHADPLPLATNLWTFPFGTQMPIYMTLSSPAVAADGTIYVGTFGGKLLAISPEGKEQWYFQAGREIKSSPAVADDGTIYFGSRDHQFYAVTPAGKLKWKFATGAWVDSSAAIAPDGTIYFGSWDKNFYALNPDGSLKWKFTVGGIVDSSPAIAVDGTVYFGAHNKKFYALDAGGKPRWTFPTEAEITSSPAIGSDGSVYCGSTDGNLYRLGADGKEIWRCRTGSGADGSPVLAENGNVIIAAAHKTLIISPAGAVIWTRGSSLGGDSWIDETPAVAQGIVCFTCPDNAVMATQFDGTFLWWAHLIANPTSSPVINRDGQIYMCCWTSLQAWQPPVPLLPARSPWPMFRADSRHTGRVGKADTSP
jgi:outer membrane protein assembly factor BamB